MAEMREHEACSTLTARPSSPVNYSSFAKNFSLNRYIFLRSHIETSYSDHDQWPYIIYLDTALMCLALKSPKLERLPYSQIMLFIDIAPYEGKPWKHTATSAANL